MGRFTNMLEGLGMIENTAEPYPSSKVYEWTNESKKTDDKERLAEAKERLKTARIHTNQWKIDYLIFPLILLLIIASIATLMVAIWTPLSLLITLPIAVVIIGVECLLTALFYVRYFTFIPSDQVGYRTIIGRSVHRNRAFQWIKIKGKGTDQKIKKKGGIPLIRTPITAYTTTTGKKVGDTNAVTSVVKQRPIDEFGNPLPGVPLQGARQLIVITLTYRLNADGMPNRIREYYLSSFLKDYEDGEDKFSAMKTYVEVQLLEALRGAVDGVLQEYDMEGLNFERARINQEIEDKMQVLMYDLGLTLIKLSIEEVLDVEPNGYQSQMEQRALARQTAATKKVAAVTNAEARITAAAKNQEAFVREQEALIVNAQAEQRTNTELLTLEKQKQEIAFQYFVVRAQQQAEIPMLDRIMTEISHLTIDQKASILSEAMKNAGVRTEGGAFVNVGNGSPLDAQGMYGLVKAFEAAMASFTKTT